MRGILLASALILAIFGLVLGACDATSDGRAAYEAGDNEAAWRSFDAAAREAGERTSAALYYDLALAALGTGRLDEADAAANKASAAGGPDMRGRAAFLRGNVAFARSVAIEKYATTPGAPPTATLRAVTLAEDAVAAWGAAASSRSDWPAARRNLERGLLRLARLRVTRQDSQRRERLLPGADDEKADPPPEATENAEGDAPLPPGGGLAELPPDQVLGVLERLREKESEKQRLRAAQRERTGKTVEKDW